MKSSLYTVASVALAATVAAQNSDDYHNQAGSRHYQCLSSINGTAYLIELDQGAGHTFSSWTPPSTTSSASPQTHPSWTPLTVSEGIELSPALCYNNGTHLFTLNSQNGHIVTYDPLASIWVDPLAGKAATAQATAFSQAAQAANSSNSADFFCAGVNNEVVCYDDGATNSTNVTASPSSNSSNDAWVTDLTNWNFTAPTTTQNPLPSIQGAVLAASDSQIFLFGGQIGANDNSTSSNATKNCNANIYSFDLSSSQWSNAGQFSNNNTFTSVNDPAVAYYNSTFYIFGGQSCTANSSDENIENIVQDFWVYTPPSTWEVIDPITSNQPPSTVGGQLSLLNATDGSPYLVLRAGYNTTNTHATVGDSDTYLFDLSNRTWVAFVGKPSNGSMNGGNNTSSGGSGGSGAGVSNGNVVSAADKSLPYATLAVAGAAAALCALLL